MASGAGAKDTACFAAQALATTSAAQATRCPITTAARGCRTSSLELFPVASSAERRPTATNRAPHRQHYDATAIEYVVHVVARGPQEYAPQPRDLVAPIPNAHLGSRCEKREHVCELVTEQIPRTC